MNPLNIKTPVYKAQWTGFANDSVRITMMAPQDYYYAQVSTDANFTPSGTKIYPVFEGEIEVDFAGAYKFFRFVGYSPGPGGVIEGLQLWLRADDEVSLEIINMAAGSGKLASYIVAPKEDPNNLPAVTTWKDPVREHTYKEPTSGGSAIIGRHRLPIMKYNSPEMNYHPALKFWGTGTAGSNAAYLSNANGIMPFPSNGQHTTYILLNNNFSSRAWIYPFQFQNVPSLGANTDSYGRPGYGVEKLGNGNNVIRFRDGNGASAEEGTRNLFTTGATTMLGYSMDVGTGNRPAVARFNARTDKTTGNIRVNSTDLSFNAPSIVGSGYDSDRTVQGVMSEVVIYNRALTTEDTRALESYFALKYGITLYPDNPVSGRPNQFDYALSDGAMLWKGDVVPSDPNYAQDKKFGDFYNRIAAILRDDVARLNNRHSHATNAGSLLHLGLAGTRLSDDGANVGFWEHNLEAVIFGDDGAKGVSANNSNCGNYDYRFNRLWLIHKSTQDDRPISLLVGAQNNSALTIGADSTTTVDYYNKLIPSNDFVMIVGASPADIVAGNYTAVVPMSYINDEYQCIYQFTEKDTYITFGYKQNLKGCYSPEDAQFSGKKTFKWTQYSSQTNRSDGTGLTIPTTPFAAVDLGDNISVTSTQVVYPPNVKANKGYPRADNTSGKGGLEVRRSHGAVNQDVVITINFDKPVMPSFSISGIDDYCHYSYDQVTILGKCSGQFFSPTLSPAHRNPSFTIDGAIATANTNTRSYWAGNRNEGKVNVEFEGAVEQIQINYRLTNKVNGTQRIFISPITLEATYPPPPVNQDGIGFAEYASETNITTCEPITYTFRLINSNCEDRYVNFTDELPANMVWKTESLALDTMNNLHNPLLDVNKYGGTGILKIDSLLIPGTSDIKFKATAVFDENAPSGEYVNIADIKYNRVGEPIETAEITETREALVNVEWQQRQGKVQVEVISRPMYKENSDFEVTYKITNPNSKIDSVFLDIDFNAGFYYINGSFRYYTDDPEAPPGPDNPIIVSDGTWTNDVATKTNNYLSLAGEWDAAKGFSLQPGENFITFKIRTPLSAVDELGENNQPTGNKEPLIISHALFSEIDDLCLMEAMKGTDSTKVVYYAKEFQIWNWADLAYLNVLIENENNPNYTGDANKKLSYYDKVLLMQNLSGPNGNYGNGAPTSQNDNETCPYLPQEPNRAKGCYGYENYISGTYTGAVENNTLKVGGNGITPLATINATITPTSDNYCWNSEGWIPVGKNNNYPFAGLFNGQGFTISELWIDRSADDYQGLFGYTYNATIDNLGVNIVDKVKGKDYVGGVAGFSMLSTINSCYVTGKIEGKTRIGGLVGQSGNSNIKNSYTTSDVTGTGNKVGGLVGSYNGSLIANSYATGEIIGNNAVGGLVGYQESAGVSAIITNCYAFNCRVKSKSTGGAGRIIGVNNSATLANNHAYDEMKLMINGIIKAPANVGANNTDGADITFAEATTGAPTGGKMEYLITNDGAGAWLFTPYTNYIVETGTNLFILTAFPNVTQSPQIKHCCIPPQITTHPATTTPTALCQNDGSFPQLSVEAIGDDLEYQWYWNTTDDNSSGVAIATDGTSSSYTPPSSMDPNDYYFYCVITDECGEIKSNPSGKHTINQQLTPEVSIALTTGTTPTCAGTALTFTATPTANGGAIPTSQGKVNDIIQGTDGATFTWTPTHADTITCVMTPETGRASRRERAYTAV
jgi:hypothetical protein